MATKRGQKPGIAAPASNGKAPAASPANAWARPLKTTGPPPGMGPADKSRAGVTAAKPSSTKTNNNNSSNKDPNDAVLSTIHRERLLHLSLTLIGQKVVASLTDGTVLEGIFHTFTPFDGLDADVKNKYVFNAVKAVKVGKENVIKTGSTVILGVDKVTQIYAKNINLDRPNKNGGAFSGKSGNTDLITDTQISGGRTAGSRELVAAGSAWTSAPGAKQTRAEALAGALGTTGKGGDTTGLKGSIGGWDQFKANQELFNVNATFDENLYTTELDKSQIDSHKIAEAERIAREIENTASTNIHIAEERGQALETDYDEEDRYSGVLTKDGKQRHEESVEKTKTTSTSAPKKMNYAAAAAKADTTKKTGPPGFSSLAGKSANVETKSTEETTETEPETKQADESPLKEDTVEENKSDVPEASNDATPDQEVDRAEAETDAEIKPAAESETETQSEEKKETKEVAKTSKLNANAKEFTFNPAAKSFTPSFAGGGASFAPQMQQPQHVVDPNMQNYGGLPMQHPHYMHAQMAQPGMMPMMTPQYPGMRYMPQYPTMDQHGVPQMAPHQPQHVPPAAGAPGAGQQPPTGTTAPSSQAVSMPSDGETPGSSSPDGDTSQPSAPSQQGPQSQQPLQQQPMTMPYNVAPPGAYFPGGAMAMHPRGPGGYPPQFVGAPQQMPVVPQGAPYRQMYPMQPGAMPPNMHMRGPGGAPYYAGPVGPIPYPPGAYGHGMMEDPDAFRGRGRGPGRGRGRGGRRAGGRVPGRGNYPHQQPANYPGSGQNSGRSTPQQHGGPEQGANMSHEGDMALDSGSQEAST